MSLCPFCAATGKSMGHGTGWVPCPKGCRTSLARVSIYAKLLDLLDRHPNGLPVGDIAGSLGLRYNRAKMYALTARREGFVQWDRLPDGRWNIVLVK